MIKYRDWLFKDYIDLFQHMIDSGDINYLIFPHSKFFYIRYHLQEKFKKRFTIRKIIEMIDEEKTLGYLK